MLSSGLLRSFHSLAKTVIANKGGNPSPLQQNISLYTNDELLKKTKKLQVEASREREILEVFFRLYF
ncbi:MAG: hypothetical protein DLD55_05635 [candidate division SR1 bacterium]|nr:MAG: hypothetical protein DLD55_05635 [candidate division SR1 bacterium]